MYSVCEWPIDYAACAAGGNGKKSVDKLSPEDQTSVEQTARDFLWNVTGRIFGTCPVEVRPCASSCAAQYWGSTYLGAYPWHAGSQPNGWWPVLLEGEWFNVSCGCITTECTCTVDGTKSLQLPGPINSVEEVWLNGEKLAPEEYRVTFGRYVTLTAEGRVWPACQDLDKPLTEPGTYGVVYQKGLDVPAGGRIAAGILANEFAKVICGDNGCQLPQRVQTITRQNVTVGFMDQFEGIEKGRTGIWLIDSWTESVNRPKPMVSVRNPDDYVRKQRGARRLGLR